VHSGAALRLLRSENILLAPDLLWAEAGNILWKKRRRGELKDDPAVSILADLRRLPLQIHSSQDLSETAWHIASSHDRSFYDSLYIALSDHQACPLVTADSKLFNTLRHLVPGILWVEDVPQ
jgi:predicted nucleic acid-binding protein